jgi:hypothetical protein
MSTLKCMLTIAWETTLMRARIVSAVLPPARPLRDDLRMLHEADSAHQTTDTPATLASAVRLS